MVEQRQGRPRAEGDRYPNGQLKRHQVRSRPPAYVSDTQIRRLVDTALALSVDPLIASPIGVLRLHNLITDRQLSTADYVGRVYGAFERHAGKGFNRRTRSPSYQAGTNSAEREDSDVDAAAEALDEYQALQDVLPERRRPREILERICVDGLPLDEPSDLPVLVALLELIEGKRIKREPEPLPPLPRTGLPLRPRQPKTRDQRFESGEFAHRAPGAVPKATHEDGSPGARDHARTIRQLEDAAEARALLDGAAA